MGLFFLGGGGPGAKSSNVTAHDRVTVVTSRQIRQGLDDQYRLSSPDFITCIVIFLARVIFLWPIHSSCIPNSPVNSCVVPAWDTGVIEFQQI